METRTRTVVAIAATVGLAFGAASATAAPRVRVANPPASVAPGASLKVAATMTGAGAAKSARLNLLLSRNAKADKSDIKLGRKLVLRKTRKRGRLKGSVKVTLPASALGTFRILACRKQKKGRKRRKVCSASRKAINISAPVNPGPGDPTPPPPTIFDLPANPLALTVTEGSGSTDTATVEPDDDEELSVTVGALTYTLAIPEDAVLSPVEVTLKPVASVAGLPFAAGSLGAAVIKPAGLQLLKPARLELSGAPALAADRRTGFGFQPGGAEFHMAPLDPNPATLSLPVTRFGGHGFADASAQEREAALAHLPTSPLDRLLHVLGHQLGSSSAAARSSYGAASTTGAVQVLQQFWDLLLDPLLTEAVADPAKVDQAIAFFTPWAAQVALLPATQAYFLAELSSAAQRLRLALINSYRAAGLRCDAGGPSLPNLVDIAKAEGALLSFGYTYTPSDLESSRQKCLGGLELDLQIATSGSNDEGGLGDGAYTYALDWSGTQTITNMELNSADFGRLEGQSPSNVTESYVSSCSTSGPDCGPPSCNASRTDEAGAVWTIRMNLNLNPGTAAGAYRLDLETTAPPPTGCESYGGALVGLARCLGSQGIQGCGPDFGLSLVPFNTFRMKLAGALGVPTTLSKVGSYSFNSDDVDPCTEDCTYTRTNLLVDVSVTID